ncbi:cryptochrome/photolyase family protein [Cognatishimia sp.]|uniref:cryptochrome/photolyase family protein n=1 Tax=Cognatishimia sp. TaxID=2211648 RepID=UPI003BA8C321
MSVKIHWFRKDLRLADNPALCAGGQPQTLALYILDPKELARMGAASQLWLFHSLTSLNASLNGQLHIIEGAAEDVLLNLIQVHDVSAVSWTRRYDPQGVATDQTAMSMLKANNITVHSTNGSLLWEPWQVSKPDGTPYKVFTPFFKRGCQAAPPPRTTISAPQLDLIAPASPIEPVLQNLLPIRRWDTSVIQSWSPGEIGAGERLTSFIDHQLDGYKSARDIPRHNATSRLSPHLHFGELSPNQIWQAISALPASTDLSHFKSELAWREFSHHLLFRNPDLDHQNLNRKFDGFPWVSGPETLQRWQQGQTGIPIVDAGMRELWQTGYMHNRVRMIVASFLVKNLRIHWRHGLAWFNDTLFDADPANNAASWQWVAGSGADAAPYFRIFNPVTQAQKFDPDAHYIKTYVPELGELPPKHAITPWLAPAEIRAQILGGYPEPVVDLKESRQRALDAFATLS